MGLPRRDAQLHTYADYLAWPDDLRYELIDGVAYLMTPVPSRPHQEIVGEIYRQAANALQGKACQAYVAPFDVRLPKAAQADEETDTVLQPDVLVVCDRRKLDERGMRGAPDWVVEVLSPATASHDQTLKLTAYERAGVPEVWLIHPTDRLVTIYRLEAAARFGRPVILELKGQTAISSVPELSIDWNAVLAQLDG